MRPTRHLLAVLLLTSFALPVTTLLAQSKAEKIDALLNRYHELRQFNGSVLVAENGEVIYKKGFGDANMQWDIPNTPETRFRIGSVTKQFTAILILQLMEEGRLELDDPISKHLPDYPKPQGDQVTIHHLLNHTSGIPSYTGFAEFGDEMMRNPYTPAELVATFSSRDLEFEPGSSYRYNNSGYFLLGHIIETITGKPYAEVLQERILTPVGLTDTGYDNFADVIERAASGYARRPDGYRNADYLDTSLPYAAGMMYATVEDLFKWDQALYTDALFENAETKELMFTPGLSNYGYGWVITDVPMGEDTVKVIGHGGGINGFSTAFMRMVDDGHLVTVMDNTQGNADAIARNLMRILYDAPVQPPKAGIADALRPIIDEQGVEAGIAHYHTWKENEADTYDFSENQLNNLGYQYLGQGDTETAIALFKLNTEMYPNGFNTFDSLGEAYMVAGDERLAIANYQKSLEMNPANTNAVEMLKKMGVEPAEEEMTLAEEVLARYTGTYELQPGFQIKVWHEGTQLKAQATGQPAFDLFPTSETRFYLKAVPAQVEFAMGNEGMAESLTLFQGGREMPAPRVE